MERRIRLSSDLEPSAFPNGPHQPRSRAASARAARSRLGAPRAICEPGHGRNIRHAGPEVTAAIRSINAHAHAGFALFRHIIGADNPHNSWSELWGFPPKQITGAFRAVSWSVPARPPILADALDLRGVAQGSRRTQAVQTAPLGAGVPWRASALSLHEQEPGSHPNPARKVVPGAFGRAEVSFEIPNP